MLELNIKCDTIDEARVYLNAPQYLNLIDDLYNSLRQARKHGEDINIIMVVDRYMPELCNAIDNSTGPY